jgi:hypothetical protein
MKDAILYENIITMSDKISDENTIDIPPTLSRVLTAL